MKENKLAQLIAQGIQKPAAARPIRIMFEQKEVASVKKYIKIKHIPKK